MTPDIARNEKNFLGCLLRSPQDYWRADQVSADMFTAPHHRDIFTAIRDEVEQGRPVSVTSLTARLPEEWNDQGPAIAYLEALKANAAEAGSAADYAELISEMAGKRRLEKLAQWIKRESAKDDVRSEDVAAAAAVQLQDIMATASPIAPVSIGEAAKRVLATSQATRESGVKAGHTTGLAALDEITGMLMGGDFIAILAALGEGKSALLAQIGKHIAGFAPVLAAHNEMSIEQNGTRALAAGANMSVRDIREGNYDHEGLQIVRQAQADLDPLSFHLYVNPRMTVRAVKARAIQMKRTIGLGAVTIDGFKRLRAEGKHRDNWERKEELTGALKELALELNVPVIVAFQRTRMGRRRDDATPHLDDGEAPSMEHDADMIIGLWQEAAWLQMNKPSEKTGAAAMDEWEAKMRRAKGTARIIGLKVRSSEPFVKRDLKWNGRTTTFEDY